MLWTTLGLITILIKFCKSAIYVDNGMDQTVQEFMSLEDQYVMQEEILTLLGLSHVPVTTNHRFPHHHSLASLMNHTVPLFMIDIYNSLTASEERRLHGELSEEDWSPVNGNRFQLTTNDVRTINESDIIMSFGNHGRQDEELQWTQLFWFDTNELPRDPNQEEIISAELRLYKQRKNEDENEKENKVAPLIRVFQLVEGTTGESNLLDSVPVTRSEERWLGLDVTKALKSWQRSYKTNQGLMVEIRDEITGEQLHPDSIGLAGNRRSRPDQEGFMVAFLKHKEDPIKRGLRIKRDNTGLAEEVDDSYRSNKSSRKKNGKKKSKNYSPLDDFDVHRDFYGGHRRKRGCQKRSLFVSFKDLGWQDWIIAPDGYAAFYCQGECSFPLHTHMNATNHAIVQTLVHLMNPEVPKPCCAPTKLSSISVLYFDESSNVILKKFRNMVVKSCGCH